MTRLVIGLKTGHHVAIEFGHSLDVFVAAYLRLEEHELVRAILHGTTIQVAIRRDSIEYITDGEAL